MVLEKIIVKELRSVNKFQFLIETMGGQWRVLNKNEYEPYISGYLIKFNNELPLYKVVRPYYRVVNKKKKYYEGFVNYE